MLSDKVLDWIKNRADFFVEVQSLLFNFTCISQNRIKQCPKSVGGGRRRGQPRGHEDPAPADRKEKTQKTLDAKYATMEERFLAYDKIISKLNSEF